MYAVIPEITLLYIFSLKENLCETRFTTIRDTITGRIKILKGVNHILAGPSRKK